MNLLYSTVNTLRDRYAPVTHTSTFRKTGQITPEEFVAAGDYLVYKFPSWSWGDAEPSRRVAHLPPGKQYLVTRNVPCHRRFQDNFDAPEVGGDGDDDEWLQPTKPTEEVRPSVGEEPDVPDMEAEEDDDALVREEDKHGRRSYHLYIMYSPFYRTPRMYLSGYQANGQPLPPESMMDDIVADYKEKTVTLEDFPFFSSAKMASVHPCKHASVMKTLLDRADAALHVRRERRAPRKTDPTPARDEWEEVDEADATEEVAIRVDQYLIVFLKFMASVTPGIEHDITMGI